jgi:gas vesicle protein
MNISVNNKLIYFGAGCGLGLLLGALFAPSSGEETRRNLSNRMDDLTQQFQNRINSSGIRDSANQAWQNVMEKGRNVVSIGRQRFNESKEAAARRFNESIEDESLGER